MIRISTLARLAEDTIIDAGAGIARRTKNFVQRTNREYKARQLAKFKLLVQEQERALGKLSTKQRKALLKDQAAINARADEIVAQRTK